MCGCTQCFSSHQLDIISTHCMHVISFIVTVILMSIKTACCYISPQTMNPDVYRGPWGGANCRESIAQPLRSCDCVPGESGDVSVCVDLERGLCDTLHNIRLLSLKGKSMGFNVVYSLVAFNSEYLQYVHS